MTGVQTCALPICDADVIETPFAGPVLEGQIAAVAETLVGHAERGIELFLQLALLLVGELAFAALAQDGADSVGMERIAFVAGSQKLAGG